MGIAANYRITGILPVSVKMFRLFVVRACMPALQKGEEE
ncbi:MAG: hypothetical protein RL240_8, partial [Planctomycetota bacterium]